MSGKRVAKSSSLSSVVEAPTTSSSFAALEVRLASSSSRTRSSPLLLASEVGAGISVTGAAALSVPPSASSHSPSS